MAARAGMVKLIAELRAMTNSGTADYTVGSTPYFSDDQLQDYLDRTVYITRFGYLMPVPSRIGNTTQWYDYAIPEQFGQWIEEDSGGSPTYWAVKNNQGTAMVINTDYTVNYQAKLVTFTFNTLGGAYFVDCKSYDLNAAAATVWRQKAAFEARSIDWSSDNHSIKASQRRDYCVESAEYYEQKGGSAGDGGIMFGEFIHTDENNAPDTYGHTPGGLALGNDPSQENLHNF